MNRSGVTYTMYLTAAEWYIHEVVSANEKSFP